MDKPLKFVETSEFGTPFLYKTVEELNEVISTEFWTNNNVRVLGRLYLEKTDCDINATLVSPMQCNQDSKIKLNMELLNYKYPQGRLIEVFGYFDAIPQQESELKPLIIRNANGVNVPLYYMAARIRNKHVPLFNDKDDEVPFICKW